MQAFHKAIKDQIDHEFTVYGKTDIPNRRYAGGTQYYTGLVWHVVLDKEGRTWLGRSFCSTKDVFSKKIGRAIAKGRAAKAWSGSFPVAHVSITTPLGKHIEGNSLRRA